MYKIMVTLLVLEGHGSSATPKGQIYYYRRVGNFGRPQAFDEVQETGANGKIYKRDGVSGN